ncbi:glycosyltransferase family 4 protein [Candidatus Daviesbacteria bacterium]|nr:glycosyltransferase family 4 protein [Candidatus Daviesbacteria bacterium]
MTAHFRPNVGGVETHLNDLCDILVKRRYKVTVLTYRPLETEAKWKVIEQGNNFTIIRIPWLPHLFYKLVKMPALEFLYLLPGLFLVTPFVLLLKRIRVIHAHGLVAGFVGVFWGKVFKRRVVISTHSLYSFPKTGIYRKFVTWIFRNASFCLGLSKQAAEEIRSLGITPCKVDNFIYWIDLEKFKIPKSKVKIRKELEWDDEFVVLFVGRLVSEKGVIELLESVKNWEENISLKIIGSGPLEELVKETASKCNNVEFIGVIDQGKLPLYYSGSDILVVPSVSEEGFGRVILESLACGTPVIGAKQGAIPEAMDESVGKLIDVSASNIYEAVWYFYQNRDKLKQLANNCRSFAERRYSEKNVEKIIKAYQG